MEKNLALITTTVKNDQEAHKIAQDLLDKRLAACIQIQPITSHFWENGKIINTTEAHIMIKTSRDILEEALKRLLDLHPYDIPEVLVNDVKADIKYEKWVKDQIIKKSCCPDD